MLSVLRNHTLVILNWTSKFSTSDLYFKVLILSWHCLHGVLEEAGAYTGKTNHFIKYVISVHTRGTDSLCLIYEVLFKTVFVLMISYGKCTTDTQGVQSEAKGLSGKFISVTE